MVKDMELEIFLIERTDVIDGRAEKLLLVYREISGRFMFQHFKTIEHRFCGAKVEGFFPAGRVGDLTEKKPGILGLEKDKILESRVRLGIMLHGCGR